MSKQQLDKLLQIFERQPPIGSLSLEEERRTLDEGGARFAVPADVALEPVDARGVKAEWLVAPGTRADRAVLYLHGGGYVIGSIKSHRYLMQNVSRHSGARTLGIDYRLAPEHPFPAAIEDACTAYQWLLGEGFAPGRIAIAGDSAGGGLTLATLLRLRDEGVALPAAGVLISPWADLTGQADAVRTRAASDPMVKPDGLFSLARHYLRDTDPRNPLASPVFADLTGLPPLLIHVGGREILYDDSVTVAANAAKGKVPVALVDEPELFHVWHAFAPMLDEGQRAIEQIGGWLHARFQP